MFFHGSTLDVEIRRTFRFRFLLQAERDIAQQIWATNQNLALLSIVSIESWLLIRDPYFMVFYNPHITG